MFDQKGYSPKCSEFGGNATEAQEDISRYIQMRKKKEGTSSLSEADGIISTDKHPQVGGERAGELRLL